MFLFNKILMGNRAKSSRILTFLLLSLLLSASLSCNPLNQDKAQTTQQIEVKPGNLTVVVNGSGNLEISKDIKLTFGVAGRIDKIYAKEGNQVRPGEVLATLETDSLELALVQAEVDQTKAQLAVTQGELAASQAKLAVTQAEVALQTAELDLDKAQNIFKWPDIQIAQANVDKAMASVKNAHDRLKDATTDAARDDWTRNVALAEAFLISEQAKLNAMLSAADTDEVAIKKRQVEAARQSLELTHQSLQSSEQSLVLNRQSVELTQRLKEQAQKQLGKAAITAPFAGAIASVSADEQDTVSTATQIIHLIDPTSMELNVQVDEADIASVSPGQRAIIELDALPSLQLDGKVDSISLLPFLEAGVIVYDVKIKFDVAEISGLRAGMSATADIITAERNNALLVPERAVKEDSQGRSIVEVLSNGQIEQRTVVTGISDGLQIEIVDGLEEGEIIKSNLSGK